MPGSILTCSESTAVRGIFRETVRSSDVVTIQPWPTEDDVGVEYLEQCLEVSGPGGSQEGVHQTALLRQFGVRRGDGVAHPAPRTAGELAGGVRRPARDGADLGEGHAEHVMQDEGDPLGRGERVEHDKHRQPDQVGQLDLLCRVLLGIVAGDRRQDALVGRFLPRALRVRSMSSEIRPTTVVSQPPMLSTASESVRLSRSQAS